MIDIKIKIKEEGKDLINKDTIKADVCCSVEIARLEETRAEKDACEMILEKAGLKRKFDIVDKTKDKRFKELEEMLDKLLKEKD